MKITDWVIQLRYSITFYLPILSPSKKRKSSQLKSHYQKTDPKNYEIEKVNISFLAKNIII